MDLNTPYTPGLREVIKLSRAEALRLNHDNINPEHFLLAIIRKGDGLAIQVLTNSKVNLDELKAEVESLLDAEVVPNPKPNFAVMPPNAEAKKVLDGMKEITRNMRHNWNGTEHLLLSIARQKDTIAARCLAKHGLDYGRTERGVYEVIYSPPKEPAKSDNPPYTPLLREIFKLSKAEAGRLSHDFIGPEHYMLAIIRKGTGDAIDILNRLSIDLNSLKTDFEKTLDAHSGPNLNPFYPNPEAYAVIKTAREIALESRHEWTATKHLLLALLKEENTGAARCLRQAVADYAQVMREAGGLE